MMPQLDSITARWLLASQRFDATAYLARYPDVARSGLPPWAHFCRYGWWLGRQPATGVPPLVGERDEASIEEDTEPLLAQWVQVDAGWQAFRRLCESPLMDDAWYRERYPDVTAAELDATSHYWRHGGAEGREPGPWFDTAFYLSQLEAPLPEGCTPLGHYLAQGRQQGLAILRQPAVLPAWYRNALRERGLKGAELAPLDPEALLKAMPLVPGEAEACRLLYVLPLDSGGTPQSNEDLMAALTHRPGTECLLLRCRGRLMQLLLFCNGAYLPLDSHRLATPVAPLPHRSEEYDRVVGQWLQRYRIDLVHVRHLAWNSLGVFSVARAQGVPVVFSLHDFYPLCPSVKLLDEQRRYCAGRCTASRGECPSELWPARQMPPLKHAAINPWQAQFAEALAGCDALVTTTAQARDTLLARMPALEARRWRVIPHGRDLAMQDLAVPPSAEEPLRVVLPGHLALAKGGELVSQLAERFPVEALELHVLGRVSPDVNLPPQVVVHGPYRREDFAPHLAEIRPHVGAVLSIWPETWCHTLTELWAAGLPVVGLDIGAVGERLHESGGGWRVAPFTVEALSAALQRARDPESWAARRAAVQQWQQGVGAQQSTRRMANTYAELYQALGVPVPAPVAQDDI
ncbi:MAG: glycosyltransferase [Pseudomonadota bacterium]